MVRFSGTPRRTSAEGMGVLLASGADANAKSSYGQTVLHRAVHSGNPIHHKVAEVLIANGADVDAKDQKQRTPLHCVGHSAAAKLLVDSGCDVDVKDSSGCAPLHYAAMYRTGAIAEVLLAKEADVNLEDKDGRTPLFWATQTEMEFGDVAQVERTAVNIVEVLRKHGGRKAGSWR